jgi:DNA-binding CsgD family transcriptional regulator
MTSSEKRSVGRRHELSTPVLAHLLSRLSDLRSESCDLVADLTEIQKALDLISCVLLECEPAGDGLNLVKTLALGQPEGENNAHFNISGKSKTYALLQQGKWVPMGGAAGSGSGATGAASTAEKLPDFEQLWDSKSQTAVLYPLLLEGRILGLLVFSRSRDLGGFSEELLDFGQVIARLFAQRLCRASGLPFGSILNLSQKTFEELALPTMLIDRRSLTISLLNKAACKIGGKFLPHSNRPGNHWEKAGQGQFLGALLGGAPEFVDALQKQLLEEKLPAQLETRDLGELGFAHALCTTLPGQNNLVALQLVPSELAGAAKSAAQRARNQVQSASASDSADALSRRLGYERWLRQAVCKLHASLDRDHILQSLADSLGRAFKATRCLVIRTDLQAQPMITHEYVEPDLSPLGLGRTGQFPMSALPLFQQKAVAYSDVHALAAKKLITDEELAELFENGIVGIAGAPLASQGVQHGVCVLLLGTTGRVFSEEDLETIELTAVQSAVALSHSQTYHQAKDQLFHMNLLGNLTEQLTGALEAARKPGLTQGPGGGKLRQDEKNSESESPPLSSREMEVLCLIASGYANREIAQRLFLTESTVELHASRIRKKLNLKSRTALVKYACDNSLV